MVQTWCDERCPPDERMRLAVHADATSITIVEERAPWRDPADEWTRSPMARLRWTTTSGQWQLYERHSDDRWHRHPYAEPTSDLVTLLRIVGEDPTGIFWG